MIQSFIGFVDCDVYFYRLSGFICMGEIFSPVKHLYLAASKGSRQEDAQVLQDIVQRVSHTTLNMWC